MGHSDVVGHINFTNSVRHICSSASNTLCCLLFLLVILEAFSDFLYLSTLIVIKTIIFIFIFLVWGCPSLDFERSSVHFGLFRQPICPSIIIVCTSNGELTVYLLSMTLSVAYAVSIPCSGKFPCFSFPLWEILYRPLSGFDHFFFVIIRSCINGSAFYVLSAHFTATFVVFNVYVDTNLSLSNIIQPNFG